MSLATVHSLASVGTNAPEVVVEVHISRGLPSFSIVGLAETAVKESRDRVRGAIINCGFEFPKQRIVANLAPADLPKEGGRFDLSIAIGVLAASNQLPKDQVQKSIFLGELALSGELRPIKGALIAALSQKNNSRNLIVPEKNMNEAMLVKRKSTFGIRNLSQVCSILNGLEVFPDATNIPDCVSPPSSGDISEIHGQYFAKYALALAAAGGHSLFMTGAPGTGKTMLASRLPGLLPPMSEEEALETAAISSLVDQEICSQTWLNRPFRSPHHSASGAALIGGGSHPRPGEISLAHNGVLFLDELMEFDRRILELLREPIETDVINVSRAARKVQFQARFMLVAAANPCRCGYFGDSSGICQCTLDQVQRYRAKVSGPLLDRIDIQINVPRISYLELKNRDTNVETSDQIRKRVIQARNLQYQRQGVLNNQLGNKKIEAHCKLEKTGHELLEKAMNQFQLSARVFHRILKVSRTIADYEGCAAISTKHLSLAIKMRHYDRMLV